MRILKSLRRSSLALFIALTMCLGLLPTTAFAAGGKTLLTIKVKDATPVTYDGWFYEGEFQDQLEWDNLSVTDVEFLSRGKEHHIYDEPKEVDAGTYEGKFDDNALSYVRLYDGERNDVTAQYDIKLVPGKLTINPAPLTVTTESASKMDDGMPLTAPNGKLEGLVNGETASFTVTGMQNDVGTSKNTYTLTWNGTAKEKNYYIASETLGTLTINQPDEPVKTDVTIRVKDAAPVYYDGEDHVGEFGSQLEWDNSNVTDVKFLLKDETHHVYDEPKETNAGIYEGVFHEDALSCVRLYDGKGNDVTAQYNVTLVPGKLEIKKRPVTLKSDDQTKPYDGTPLTAKPYVVSDDTSLGFVDGEGVTFSKEASITNEGNIAAEFNYSFNEGTTAGNYAITPVYGKLTITEADEPTNEYDIEYKVLRANGEWDTLEDVSHGTYSEELTWAAIEEQVKDVVSSHEADGYKLLTDYTKPLTIADRGDGKKTVTIELYEDKVGKDENGQLTGEGDCVPDAYQAVVTYKVENGQFKDEQTARKYVIDLYKLDSDLTWKPIENPTLGETVAHARSEMVAFEGFKEDNWKGDVPAADTKAENGKEYTFAYEPEYKTFTVHYRLEGAETDLKVENVSIQCAQPFDGRSYANAIIMVDGKQYAMTSQSGAFVAEKVTDNMEAYVYYLADNKGDPTDPDNKGDGIPDAYQVRVEFKVEHGDWDNTTNDGKPRYAYVTNRDIDGKPVPFGTEGSHAKLLEGQIPAVGHNPEKPGYCADGAWDADLDVEFTSTDVNRSFTFVYVKASLNVTKSAALTVERAEPENEGEQGKVTACYVDYTVTLTNENLGPQYFVELRDVMQRGLDFDLDNLNFVLNGSPVEGLESEVRPIEYNVTDNHSQENSQATIYFQLVKNGQDGTFFDNGDVITVTYKATVDLTSDVFRDADGNALEDEALLTSIKDLYNHVYATTWDKSWDTPAAE